MNVQMKTPSVKSNRRPSKRVASDNEFLPAALEILETPASPLRTAMIWFICVLAAATLIWTWFGTFDIVASAQGKVQPTGRVKVIQSIEVGKTIAIPVNNGTKVKAGDVLVRLDDTEITAEQTAGLTNLYAYRAEVSRRKAVQVTIDDWLTHPDAIRTGMALKLAFPQDIPGDIAAREQLVYNADLSQLDASLDNLDAQRQQRQAEVEGLDETIAAQQKLVTTLTERVAMRSELIASQAGSRAQVIDALQQLQEAQATLASQTGQLATARTALNVAASESAKLVHTFVADTTEKQAAAARQVDELTQQVVKSNNQMQSMTILSPVDGIVQASAITTVGQVVSAGSELMRIVPENAALEIEAYLPNHDIGFVSAGQDAVIKVEAYPFTRYGMIEGRVLRVATDAIPEPDAQQVEAEAAKELQSTIPTGNAQRIQNLVFPVTVKPSKITIDVDGKAMPLSPGMAVTVEVKTGKRRILEYLFSPLAEITSQAMGER
ncbi:HlyD family type I secretion periplasmic adaptor subunit [Phyllobacterium bourgognense]|uniref:Membrane fusion protein (MFP) family protein n=1 Tax=Phyllobacterium bourgognense TaxID=314236 RepID=A0A368YK42_9HYPH|nr:HlyD family type I secretion periplasmic adaptor subunit [Phyllobacterium bourgognense]RCW80580.1 hemolysin D [Phyllobacterium bourgognense]